MDRWMYRQMEEEMDIRVIGWKDERTDDGERMDRQMDE